LDVKSVSPLRNSLDKLLPLLILFALVLPVWGQETVTVLQVIDGETIKIEYHGARELIRLIGIDAPPNRANRKALREAEKNGEDVRTVIARGREAASYVKTLAGIGETIRMEFGVEARNRRGRLLGYVYLSNGSMLNEEIVRGGYAAVSTFPPNLKYQERFLAAYEEARKNRRGLWR
jgi:micrococcal nuclease